MKFKYVVLKKAHNKEWFQEYNSITTIVKKDHKEKQLVWEKKIILGK